MLETMKKLEEAGELIVVERQVDPKHELAAVTRAAQRKSNSAVLFRNVARTSFPVLSNLYCGRARMCSFIGAEDKAFCQRWNTLLDTAVSPTGPVTTAVARPEDLVHGRLRELPLITYHGKDAGPYFTSAIYLAKDPASGVPNLSFHRSMYVNDGELRVRLGESHDLAKYQRAAEECNEPLEAALLIGVDPAIFLAAGTSLPLSWNELALAAAISGKPIDTFPGQTVDLPIPAGTQFVVEGHFLPNVRRAEGPFGEFMGYYVPVGENHVFEVSAVYWQRSPIFHSILCGSTEDISLLEAVTAAKVFRHLNEVVPGVIDVSCAPTVLNTTIQIRQQYEGHARQVLLAAFGADLDFNKICAVVDEDVDIYNWDEILWAFATRGRADERVLVIPDVPGFYRDPSQDHWGRLGIDATRPFGRAAEFERKSIPGEDEINLDDYVRR